MSLPAIEDLRRQGAPRCSVRRCCTIILAVAEAADLPATAIIGKRRPQRTADVRHIAMLLCRELTDASYPALAAIFRRHHTSVMHGVEHALCLLDRSVDLRAVYLNAKVDAQSRPLVSEQEAKAITSTPRRLALPALQRPMEAATKADDCPETPRLWVRESYPPGTWFGGQRP